MVTGLQTAVIGIIVVATGLASAGTASARDGLRQVFPATSPPVTNGFSGSWAMAFDEARGETVLFGNFGWPVPNPYSSTWVWDGSNWTQRQPAVSPGLSGGAMAYDASRAEVVLVGERGIYGSETWVWDGTNWAQRQPAASLTYPTFPRWAMADDPARAEVVLFREGPTGDPETWVWNGLTWMQRFPPVSPPARVGHAMVYDHARGTVVLFGGGHFSGGVDVIFSDTWAWDGSNWSQKFPATSPPKRFHTMTYHRDEERVVLAGGGDAWVWDGVDWTQIVPAGRLGLTPVMAYDTTRKEIVAFGGLVEGTALGDDGPLRLPAFLNDTWLIATLPLAGVTPTSGVRDLDGDGAADLLWRNIETGSVAAWRMTGPTVPEQPPFDRLIASDVPLAWQTVGVGDVNGDGKGDLIWRHTENGDVAIWFMDGQHVMQEPIIAPAVPLAWRIVGIGDLDGDGKADLIWRHTQNGDVAVWLMNGPGVKQGPIIAPGVPLAWDVVGVGDVNGDGKADLIWRHTQNGDVALWLMDGVTVKQAPVVARGVTLGWQIAGVADLDGDGKVDVIWRDRQSGDVAAWLMNGGMVARTAVVSLRVPLAWQVVRVDDVNGDGQADLIWRHTQTGTLGVWFMQGFTVLHATDVLVPDGTPQVTGPEWQVQ